MGADLNLLGASPWGREKGRETGVAEPTGK